MSENSFSGIIMQPHDTPLSQLLSQHREILRNLSQITGIGKLYPLVPCHCLMEATMPVKELKKKITYCKILPPQLQEGFLFRPVEVAGAQLQALPPQLVHKILPILSEQALNHIPTGFIFGYVNSKEEAIQKGLASSSTEIQSLTLRVFRLHQIEYRWNQDDPSSSLNWTMELPQWVKLPSSH